jgi:mRNA interferase MazF
MIAYDRGDVILVNIPYSGSPGQKRRPAAIVSTRNFNSAGIKLVVLAITSNILPPFRPGDTLIGDWKAAGLVKPSAARGVLATVDKSDIVRTLGKLTASDFERIEQALAEILGLAASSAPPGGKHQ